VAPDNREERLADLLDDNVVTEIRAMNAVLDLGLSEHQIENLAGAISANLLYAFDIEWAPDWVKPGEVHSWQDDGSWRARCGICLEDSPAAASEREAVSWARRHESAHASR
jgi:hypothetical protein